jgi:hypothetical protein
MNALDFLKEAIKTLSEYDFISSIEIQLLDEPVAKIKTVLTGNSFMTIFYNAETRRTSFALIKNNKRIYGADNTKNWHVHPFESPDSHIETEPVILTEFLETLSSNRSKWQ